MMNVLNLFSQLVLKLLLQNKLCLKKLKQIQYLILCHVFLRAKLRIQGKKRGREVPGPLKKVLGLLDFFSPGTTGPQDLQGL